MLDSSLRDSVGQIVEMIWTSTLSLPVMAVDPTSDELSDALRDQRSYVGIVQITGGWDGAVAVHCSYELARQAASRFLGVAEADVSVDDLQDALGELTNMIGGNFKALLPDRCMLGLPVVVDGAALRLRLPGNHQVLKCAFVSESQPLTVTVLKAEGERAKP